MDYLLTAIYGPAIYGLFTNDYLRTGYLWIIYLRLFTDRLLTVRREIRWSPVGTNVEHCELCCIAL